MAITAINKPVLAASIVMAVTFLVHVFAGGPELYGPIRESSLSMIEKSTWSVVWHFTSLFWGADHHLAVQEALRPFYRYPLVEPLILLGLFVQLFLGARILIRRRVATSWLGTCANG